MLSIKKARRAFCQILFAAALLLFAAPVFANDYQKAWDALANNDRKTARQLLEKALKDPATAADAALTLLLLNTYDGHETEAADYWKKAAKDLSDPYPYLYALWFNGAVAGDYGRKNKEQEKLLKALLDDLKCPGTVQTSARYTLGHHYLSEGKFKEMREAWASTSDINEWQFVGPFDNLSGSGFDKNYPPIAQPEPSAMFKSTYNADIQWFKPSANSEQGFVTPTFFVRYNTGIVFAQTFVTAPADLNTTLALGFSGNIRVWVNDRLLISEQEYRSTDFDLYKAKCSLKKGVNRVLVQLGFEDEDSPTFVLRFLDAQAQQLPGLTCSATYAPYFKDNTKMASAPIPFFAEAFFEEKIKAEPDHLLHYILLCKTYLRSGKNQEALAVIQKALQKAPENNLLHMEYILVLNKTENRTERTQELQRIKDGDPSSLSSHLIRFREEMENEHYDEAEKVLDQLEHKFGEDEGTFEKRIKLASAQQKMEDLLAVIVDANERYPGNAYFNEMVHNVALHLRKDPKAAIAINEKFLNKYFVMPTVSQLISEYFEVGQNDKAVKLLTQLRDVFPSTSNYHEQLFKYYYGAKENRKAKQAIDAMLGLAPYHADNHESAALLYEQTGDEKAALASFQKALQYNPNDFDTRRRVREMQDQTDLTDLLPKHEPYELIKKSKGPEKTGEFDWYYVLDEAATILYPERCSETYYTIIVKVLNEKGIDLWKERSLGYNPWRQRLIIEKAEVVKPGGSKFVAEQNDNDLVFTNLAKGDAVYIRYRILSYAYGRMAREHWNTYAFNAFVPTDISRYTLLAPKSLDVDFKSVNNDIAPAVREVDDFKVYTWQSLNEAAMKHENLMPRNVDVAKNIHVSTIHDWQEIANWYSDLSAIQAKQDYEVQQAVQALLPAGQTFTPLQKAQKIYAFIVKNISYSSVSFRQSAYVPQKASKVLQTKLGDCKDLATLYAAMAREAGLEANLVLLNTRDNGEQSLPLHSVDFNHCIVKVKVDGQTWYLELTGSNLPFGSLPNYDLRGYALEIPFNGAGAKPGIFQLSPDNRTRDFRRQTMQITIKNRDLSISVHPTVSGALTQGVRETYATLNREKQIEEIQKSLGGYFSNPVTVKDVAFGALDELRDTIQYHAQFNVRNEVIEIGDLKTFRAPFYYTFLKPDAFQEETRKFPINYWEYEDADEYQEEVNIDVPAGQQITEVPKDVTLSFGGTEYKLTYVKKSPTSLRVVRQIKINRSNIAASDYPAFRTFVDDVVAAENRYVAYK